MLATAGSEVHRARLNVRLPLHRQYDTNARMRTRERLLANAADLFAQHGFRGASVRAICDRANANPGAVSYHFGGKRQLYRAVLRAAAERLNDSADPSVPVPGPLPASLEAQVIRLYRVLDADRTTTRLLLRDLADGGEALTEALSPALRAAIDALLGATAVADEPGGEITARLLFLAAAAPLLLVTVAWPVLQRPLGLTALSREEALRSLIRWAVVGAGSSVSARA